MPDLLAVGNGLIGGGGITYTYTDFELTAAVGDGFIDAPGIDISLSAQTAILRVGTGTIGAGLPTLGFQDWSAELATAYGTIGTGDTQLRDIVRTLFPALSPSSRNFTPPEYALSKYKTINGAKSRRLWASQPGGGTLDLEFVNINDDDAESILASHDIARGAANDVILPDAVLWGAEGDLLAYMRSPGGQAWAFDGPPEVQSVKQGISTVRVKLAARRKQRFNSVGSLGSAFAVGAAPVDEIDPISFDDCDFAGRPPDEGASPPPGALWVSKLAASSAYTISDGAAAVEYGQFGNSYHVLKISGTGGTRIAVVKRNRAGGVLWQRISNIQSGPNYDFTDIKTLTNGNVVVLLGATGSFTATQRLLMFSSSGILLRSRQFDPNPGYAVGMRIKDQTAGQVWGAGGGIFGGSNHTFLLTVSLVDNSTFGDVSDYYRYSVTSPSGFTRRLANHDVRPLANGNLFMLATYNDSGNAPFYHCLELSPSGSTLVQVAAFQDSATVQLFGLATPFSDGSVILSNTLNRHLKIDSSFNQVWYKQAQLRGDGPMYPVLDSAENMYYASRSALGDGDPPTNWNTVGGSAFTGCAIEKIDKDFTSIAYSVWGNSGLGASSFAYLGTNSGIDLVNGRFIGCGTTGNNVYSHSLEIPTTSIALALSGGETAKVGTQYITTAPFAEPTLTVTRSVPTMSIASASVSYVSETWTFSDPGSTLAWNFYTTAP
jgi:hypothetical protein